MQLRACLGILAMLLLASPATHTKAQTESQAPYGPDAPYSLDGLWQFAFAPHAADADALADFWKPGFRLNKFRDTPVPSNWALQGYETPVYKPFKEEASEGFYTRTFVPPADMKGKRILLHFGGVWDSAEVWINGTNMGRHDSGFTSFAMDVSKVLKPGEENRISVRVRQTNHDYLFDANDDWSLGGIYRDVWLESMPAARWIDRVETRTTFDPQFREADLNVRALINDSRLWPMKAAPPFDYEMRFRLNAPDGSLVEERSIPMKLHSGEGYDLPVTLHLSKPIAWTAETPNLYTLRVELLEEGKVAHFRTVKVGVRQISTANGVFRINGVAVKLKGVDRHDEYPDVGRATRPQDWLKDITLMKAGNINFIRTSHYPPAEGFLDLCDKMGMYVEDEVPMGFGGDHAQDPSLIGATALRVFETVKRDINHPSVIMWSVGNEDPVTAVHIEAMRAVHGIDPTRPVLMPQKAQAYTPPEADILAPHYSSPYAFDELGASALRPILSTEHTHAYSVDGIEGFGGFADKWYELMHHPTAAGAAIWMWADQGLLIHRKTAHGEEPFLLLNNDGVDGIVNSDRTPQRDYWEAKAVYAPVYPRISGIRFALGDHSVRIPIQNDYDFTNLSDVKIHWQLMEDDHQLAADDARVEEIPHAAGWLEVPLTALKQLHSRATYYILFTFSRLDGSEISRRSVELLANPSDIPTTVHPTVPLSVQQAVGPEKETVVHAGDVEYRFDPATALLKSICLRGIPVSGAAKLSIWRPLNSLEIATLKPKMQLDPAKLPDLNQARATVRDWRVESSPNQVRLTATADSIIDAANSFSTHYVYTVGPDGSLTVQYDVNPRIESPMLPKVEMMLPVVAHQDHIRWLGLGPVDTYPNKRAAGTLGVWSATIGSPDVIGNKTTRWAEISAADKSVPVIRIEDSRFIQLEPGTLHIISNLEGLPMKNRRPEKPEERLDSIPGSNFHAAFTVRLLDM